MTSARKQFARVAHAYATSRTHAKGEDLARLATLVSGEAVILDVGTGAGHALAAVATGSRLAVGVDPTREMLAVARGVLEERGVRAVLVEADAAALPFATGAADAAVSRLAAHHFPRVADAFAEIARVLRPRGAFYLVDNHSPPDPELDRWLDTLERLKDPSHVRSHSLERWQELLRDAGLRPRVEATFHTDVVTEDWLARSATSAASAQRARAMLREAGPAAREVFRIRADGFSLLKAIIVATKA